MVTEVQSKTEPETAPRQKNGTWPFDPLTAARPRPFVECKKPTISLGGQDEPDLSCMYGGADSKGESLYGTALMVSGPAAFKHKPSAGDDSFTVFVDSRASGHLLRESHYLQSQASSVELRYSHYASQDFHCRRSLAEQHGRRDT